MYKFVSAAGLIAAFVLSGCAGVPCGNPHAYYSNTAGPPLKAPPGLTAPTPDQTYAIPGEKPSTGKRTDLDASGACIVLPPKLITPQSSAKPGSQVPAPAAGTKAAPAVASGGGIG